MSSSDKNFKPRATCETGNGIPKPSFNDYTMSKSGRPRCTTATCVHEAWARCVKCVNNPSHGWCYHTKQDLDPYVTTPINTPPANRVPVIVNYPSRQQNPDQVSPTVSSEESFESADDSPTHVPKLEHQINPNRLQPFKKILIKSHFCHNVCCSCQNRC